MKIHTYDPTKLQAEIHFDQSRFRVVVAGRRSGKSVWALNEAIRECIQVEGARVWIVTPTFGNAKDIYWHDPQMLERYLPVGTYLKKNDSELLIQFHNKSVLQFKGADRPELMRGSGLNLIVLDEVAQFRYPAETWETTLRPALSDKNGRAAFIGTPEGENFFYDIYKYGQDKSDWRVWLIPTAKSGAPWTKTAEGQAELAMLKTEAEHDSRKKAAYMQEYECDFSVPVLGAIYQQEMFDAMTQGRVGEYKWNPDYLVDTAWDFGFTDKTTVTFSQRVGTQINLIDYIEGSNTKLEHFFTAVKAKPYAYAHHYAPHDAQHSNLQTGKSILEIARELNDGKMFFTVVPKLDVKNGIELVRHLFPKFCIDAGNCELLIKALKNYRTEYRDKLQDYNPEPLHDWSSHACDSVRYLAVAYREELQDITKVTTRNVPSTYLDKLFA